MQKNIAYGFYIFIIAMLLFNLTIFLPPLLLSIGEGEIAQPIYWALGFTCHQLDSRSYCYYAEGENIISDCTPQNEIFQVGKHEIIENSKGEIGYKIPVCSRDIGIYFSMLIGGLVFLFLRKIDDEVWPHPIFLIIAMVPIVLDGGTQILHLRESTNIIRFLTGAIIGIVIAFYFIPALNQIFNSLIRDLLGKKKK
ncbi:MAG: DUF2085 domain-containing protein [Candidatus Micrarchaeota archaeon]